MKAYQIAILQLVLLLAACSKEPAPEPPAGPWWGETRALENNQIWQGKPYAVVSKDYPTRVLIAMDSVSNGYYVTKGLNFYRIPLRVGTYPVLDNPPQIRDSVERAKYYYLDYDVLYGVYKVLESDTTNAITISSYDSVSREIKGSFNVTFVPEHLPYPGAPDTIRFRNGQFHTKIIK